MDSITLIAVASIITAGITTAIGLHDARDRRRQSCFVSIKFHCATTRRRAHNYQDIICRLAMIESTAIYCFVVSMILIFANPFWNHVIAN